MTYCKNCGSEITETDTQAGYCTQCKTPLVTPDFKLEQQLLMSIREVQSERDAGHDCIDIENKPTGNPCAVCKVEAAG